MLLLVGITLVLAATSPDIPCAEANLGDSHGDLVCTHDDRGFRWKASNCTRPDPQNIYFGHHERERYRICLAKEGELQRTLFRLSGRPPPGPEEVGRRKAVQRRQQKLEELAVTQGVPLWFYGSLAFLAVCLGLAVVIRAARPRGQS
jgi:hypothetical protein